MGYRSVSDDILEEATWKNEDDKNKTIDKVIINHNYLRSAYIILPKIQPEEKYYPFIKDMAIRERKSIGDYNKPWIGDIEFALYGLAKFRKREDIKIIKGLLISNVWSLNSLSFKLMREFPDTTYLEVFETYYKRNYYRNICIDESVDNAIHFVQTVASYKDNRSAKILESILNRKPFINCSVDAGWLKEELIYAIWNNPCVSYFKLRQQIEGKVKDYEKNRITLSPPDPATLPADTSIEKIRW